MGVEEGVRSEVRLGVMLGVRVRGVGVVVVCGCWKEREGGRRKGSGRLKVMGFRWGYSGFKWGCGYNGSIE